MMLPRHGKEQGLTSHKRKRGSGELPYERLSPQGRLPTAVDWRGTGADNVVKDQATCGSCWAFGATAALQSAYWMATGAASPGILQVPQGCVPCPCDAPCSAHLHGYSLGQPFDWP